MRRVSPSNPDQWWTIINDLIRRGHDYDTIVNVYTLAHINHFIREIDQQQRVDRINRIYEYRVAQLDNDGYKKEIQRLRQFNRVVDQQHALVEGRTLPRHRGPMTPEEQRALDLQAHFQFKDLSPQEQERINSDIASMWAQIPPHLHEKARDVKGWKQAHGG